jgi:acetyl esterase/lipase
MKRRLITILSFAAATVTFYGEHPSLPPLLEARQGFQTRLLRKESVGGTAEKPPAGVLELVIYPAPLGQNAAYVSPNPADGKKYPAIIWLVGGFSNSIGDIAWTPGPEENDQSAAAFREHGIVMMYPSLRGGNDNPGYLETFMGEVDDVLAATKYLRGKDYVDGSRIYVGGHSTGGTLALLIAAASQDRLRAVFALGPVEDVTGYGAEVLPFDMTDQKERQLRAPLAWLNGIRCPTFVFEGTKAPSNIESLDVLATRSRNSLVQFIQIPGETHFSIIAPLTTAIAHHINTDTHEKPLTKFGGKITPNK